MSQLKNPAYDALHPAMQSRVQLLHAGFSRAETKSPAQNLRVAED